MFQGGNSRLAQNIPNVLNQRNYREMRELANQLNRLDYNESLEPANLLILSETCNAGGRDNTEIIGAVNYETFVVHSANNSS
jgi:hypothetical protein